MQPSNISICLEHLNLWMEYATIYDKIKPYIVFIVYTDAKLLSTVFLKNFVWRFFAVYI